MEPKGAPGSKSAQGDSLSTVEDWSALRQLAARNPYEHCGNSSSGKPKVMSVFRTRTLVDQCVVALGSGNEACAKK